MMSKGHDASIPTDLRVILKQRPILWLGAGASRQADPPIPTLAELADELVKHFEWEEAPRDGDPYRLFDAFLADRIGTHGDLEDFLETRFRPGGQDPEPGDLHQHLAILAAAGTFPAVIDTNYDLLLLRVLQNRRVPHTPAILNRNLHLSGEGLRYLSIHGGQDDWSKIVLTGASYKEFRRRYPFLQAQLDVLLFRHPVLFVGCSMEDPRIVEWLEGLDEEQRQRLKSWLAVVGPGTPETLAETERRPGTTFRDSLGDHLKLAELPSFSELPRWFGELAEPARREQEAQQREVTVEIEAEAGGWTFRGAGEEETEPPPDLKSALIQLRDHAGAGLPAEPNGELSPEAQQAAAALQGLATGIGRIVTSLLPAAVRGAITKLAAGTSLPGRGLVRLRVRGAAANDALLLPWELLFLDDRFPVASGEIDLVREAVREGLDEGIPEPPPPLAVVAHLAAPKEKGIPELNLEEAAFRMAQALDQVRERTRFTEMGTLDDLAAAAKAVQPTLLHFAGHGMPGRLVFENDTGGAEEVGVDELVGRLRSEMDGRLPLAVWLSCCYGAGPVGEAETAPPQLAAAPREWGVAAAESPSLCADLHRAGIPQVLGYFGPVPDPLAVEVDRRLFEGLAETGNALHAVRRARLATHEAIATPAGPVRFPLAWSLLALYHRGPDRPLTPPSRKVTRELSEALEPEVLSLSGVEALRHGFIGRRRLLAELRQLHREGERVLGLYGLGGLGKTAAMIRLCSILLRGETGWEKQVLVVPVAELGVREPGPQAEPLRRLWARIDLALAERSLQPADWSERVAGVEAAPDRAARLAALLLSVLGDCILYLDNAETLQEEHPHPAAGSRGDQEPVPWMDGDVAAFMETLCRGGSGSPTVLLTTRLRPADTPGKWIEIPPCSEGEIFRMTGWWSTLQRLPPVLRRELAAERLAGHPRAVQWVEELVAENAARWEAAGGRRLRPSEEPEIVRKEILEPALGRLPGKIDAKLALHELVDRLQPAPRTLLGECTAIGLPVEWTLVERLGGGAATLRDRGLLTRFAAGEDAWGVHPFVRDVLLKVGEKPPWTPAGRALLGEYWRERAKAPAELEEALGHFVAAELWKDAVGLLSSLSNGYRRLGWYRARLDLVRSHRKVPWPEEQRDVWLYHLGAAATAMGRYEEAGQALRESVDLAQRVHGTTEHASVAASLHGLANVYNSQGRYADAEQAYKDSIDIQQRVYGTREHASVAASLHGLANVYDSQGRYADAEQAYKDSIDITQRVYGTREHAEVAASLHGLANVYNSQGRYADAEQAYKDSIDIKQRVYGTREHASVAASLAGLANVLTRQGRYADAEQAYKDSIDIQQRVYGTREHAEVAASLHGLANVYDSLGRAGEAENAYREVLDIECRVYGTSAEERPLTSVTTLTSLGSLLHQHERTEEAVDLYVDAWRTALRHRSLWDAAQVYLPLMALLVQTERQAEAKVVTEELGKLLNAYPEDHPVRLEVQRQLAAALAPPAHHESDS